MDNKKKGFHLLKVEKVTRDNFDDIVKRENPPKEVVVPKGLETFRKSFIKNIINFSNLQFSFGINKDFDDDIKVLFYDKEDVDKLTMELYVLEKELKSLIEQLKSLFSEKEKEIVDSRLNQSISPSEKDKEKESKLLKLLGQEQDNVRRLQMERDSLIDEAREIDNYDYFHCVIESKCVKLKDKISKLKKSGE